VVESPRREPEPVLNGRVEFAIQDQPRGTADAVRAAAAQLEGADTALVINGATPLASASLLPDLAAAHARSGAPPTVATAVVEQIGDHADHA